MSLNGLQRSFVTALLVVGAASVAHAQGAVEYGTLTSGTASAVSSVKPTFPTIDLAGAMGNSGPAPSSSPSASPSPAPAPGAASAHLVAGAAEAAAATNRKTIEGHAGPDAGQVTLHSTPDHAQVWIDGQYVGATPLDLKLAPGHHKVLMHAADRLDATQDVELAGKQVQPVAVSLKPRYQNQVSISWPSHN
ncbi:MAG: PEGA domain-containing protein [Candidatus Acidiferrales bacterium]